MGWRLMEGFVCQPGVTCTTAGFDKPLTAYGHSGGNNAIIGGFVYRGNPASPFYGSFFYGDNGSGTVRAIKVVLDNGVAVDSVAMTAKVTGLSSFGIHAHGSLYATSVSTHLVYRLTSADLTPTAIRHWDRKTARALAPVYGRDVSGLGLRDLQGRRVSGQGVGNGVYFTKGKGDLPAMVPVIR